MADLAELWRALGALAETPRPELQPIADLLDLGPLPPPAAHGELFLFQLYPYGSVYLGAEGMMGGEAEDRIAGFWRALGQAPPPRPDHLPVMLGLLARLGELEAEAAASAAGTAARGARAAEPGGGAHAGEVGGGPRAEEVADSGAPAAARWRHARGAFLWEHLASWLPLFLGKLLALEGVAAPFYLRWAALLLGALREEAAGLRQPARLPLHLRAAPAGLVDPREGSVSGRRAGATPDRPVGEVADAERDAATDAPVDTFLRSLLSPVRSGMVLVRADLSRAARELGVGLRAGGRHAVLTEMLAQDPGALLAWLAGEAEAWAARHRPELHPSPRLARFWQARAESAASLLRELAAEA